MKVTPVIPVRSIPSSFENAPERLTIVISTGSCSTFIFDAPCESSPEETTTVGARRTTVVSDVTPGRPVAPRSV